MEAVPDAAHSLVTQYGETLQQTIQLRVTVLQVLVCTGEQ